MSSDVPPRWIARNVLIDMDDTITQERRPWPDRQTGNYFVGILRELVAKAHGLGSDQALARICQVCDPQRECISGYVARLGVTMESYWQALMDWQGENLFAYPDAVEMVRGLAGRGFRLYTATSNSPFAARAKLACAGLADRNGSPYFAGFFGGDLCPGGKTGPDFYRAILQAGGFDPAETVMIGDNPINDLEHARAAGIDRVILPRRGQPQEWVIEPDGGLYVRSLTLVESVLQRFDQGD